MTDVTLTAVAADDQALALALESAGLPTDDLRDHGRIFYRVENAGQAVVFGGLELHGEAVLLRSLVLDPRHRGAGTGTAAVAALLREAVGLGAMQAFLLTTDAAPFFTRLGFSEMPREAAPEAIRGSRQASLLCPASATFMARPLTTESSI